ncbi:MAG: MFS transporter [Maledivibacter sp.]|nr:MFS transporter [Maledivibacter sp.]
MTMSVHFLNKLMGKRELSNLILFSLGKLVSLFGTFIYAFAIGLYVLELTGSGLSFATTLFFSTIPMVIINPIAGVLADRLNKKILVVSMDLLNGVLLIGLYFISLVNGLSLTMIYLSTFIMTSFITIFDISFEAAKPNIVSKNNLMSVNSISKIIDSIATILGPMVGGILFAIVDIRTFIVFNGVSFILSGISEMFIDFKFNYEEHDEEKKEINLIKDVKEGFGYMLGEQEIISKFMVVVFLNFSLGLSISVPLPYIINNVLGLGSKYLGIIQGSFPIGLIIGAVFVGKLLIRLDYNRILMTMNFILAISIFMIGIPVFPFNIITNEIAIVIYYCLVMSIVGVAISFIDIPLISILQSIIPDEYRGRVLSLVISMGKIISPLAFMLAGALINILPVYLLQLFGSMILITSNIVHSRNSRKGYFEYKRSLINEQRIQINIIYIMLELFLFIIIRPKNVDMFFLIWILLSLLLLLDNIINKRANNPPKHLNCTNDILGIGLLKKDMAISRDKRIYGGAFDEMNLVYLSCLTINFIGYMLVCLRRF